MIPGSARLSMQVRYTASLLVRGRGTWRRMRRAIRPDTIRSGSSRTSPGLTPSHEQKDFTQMSRQDRLLTVASGKGQPSAVALHADAAVSLSVFSPAFTLEYPITGDRCVLLYVTSGSIS